MDEAAPALIVDPMAARLIKKQVGGMEIIGFSVAGVETVVAVPELNVCFDAGRAPTEIISIDNLCLTHGHMDHAAGLAYYLSQRGFIGTSPGRIIVPRPLAQPVQALMAVWADIEGHHSAGQILAVEPGQDVTLRRNLLVRPFAVDHGAAALGYSVIEVRHKLKPEYRDLNGPQLVELKKKGVEIQEYLQVPLVAYCGDTALGAFLDDPMVRDARVLVVECTFYDADHVTRARAGRHIHVRDLPELMRRVKSPDVLLTHVSQRTDLRVAMRLAAEVLPPDDHARITFLMDRPARPRRPHAAVDRPAATSGK